MLHQLYRLFSVERYVQMAVHVVQVKISKKAFVLCLKFGKVVLLLNKEPCHEDVCGGGIAPRSLTSELDGGEWSASRPGRFTPGNHRIVAWMGPRASLDAVMDRKSPLS
jgi:hypothetical protein